MLVRIFTLRMAHAIGCLALLTIAQEASAQIRPPAVGEPAQFDPSDAYFQAFLSVRSSEELESRGDFAGAMEKIQRAQQLFGTIRKFYPEWKPEMVTIRSEKTNEAVSRVSQKAQDQLDRNRNAVAELEGGVKQAVQTPDNGDIKRADPLVIKEDPATTQRLAAAEAEVRRLRELASQPPEQASREKSRADDMRRQNDALKADLRNAEANLQSMRARLAAAPVENEVKSLNQRIESLEQERQAMAMALTQSRGSHTEALSRIATLEADLKVLDQKRSDLDRDLKTERDVANSVVAGQRKQLDLLEKQLEQKTSDLASANEKISNLSKELDESRMAFSQLRNEHDTLIQERDQMSALLKLNESGRIQDLIEQNMSLAKNLREANEKVESLSRENNSDKDAYTDALRDLAIAKTQINNLQQEKRDQDKRLEELEKRLKSEEAALAKGESNSDPAETELLRDIIKRQLRTQERRRQARELLVDAARELGTGDDRISQAIEIFDAGEIALSPEEQKLIADRQVDGEFVSPFARDRASVRQATSELNRDITVFERTAEKSFVAGRLLPTRELYEMIIEQHPGHIPSLCKLGVVQLKLDDPMAAIDAFRRAVELEENNAYAHRMLGFSFMRVGDIPAADSSIAKSVELAPNDAKSQLLLATLRYRLGRLGEAESHFKAAINADPMPSEPYYNLALLCSRDRRFEDAKNYYQQALERGAQPDPKLEETIRRQ
jgi:tetratricopeptide (TPR) repeat protein